MQGAGPAGDLYVSITVDPHPSFRREGADIWVEAAVPLTTAVLGGSVRIPTIDGDVELKIPAGSQPEERKVLRRRGVQEVGKPDGDRGDQWVVIKVQIPKNVSEKGKELLEEFARVEGEPRPSSEKRQAAGGAKASSSSDGKRPFTTDTKAADGQSAKEGEERQTSGGKGFFRSAFEKVKKNLSEDCKDGKDGSSPSKKESN